VQTRGKHRGLPLYIPSSSRKGEAAQQEQSVKAVIRKWPGIIHVAADI
jgi:hypothetical protein